MSVMESPNVVKANDALRRAGKKHAAAVERIETATHLVGVKRDQLRDVMLAVEFGDKPQGAIESARRDLAAAEKTANEARDEASLAASVLAGAQERHQIALDAARTAAAARLEEEVRKATQHLIEAVEKASEANSALATIVDEAMRDGIKLSHHSLVWGELLPYAPARARRYEHGAHVTPERTTRLSSFQQEAHDLGYRTAWHRERGKAPQEAAR